MQTLTVSMNTLLDLLDKIEKLLLKRPNKNPIFTESTEIIRTTLIQKKTITHLKGFASGIKENPPTEMIDMIANSDAVVFDGDNYNVESYTKVLKAAVDQLKRNERQIPTIVAFRYDKTEEEFKNSWENIDVPILCYKVKENEVNPLFFQPPIDTSINTEPTEDQKKYVALGLFAMEFTGTLNKERKVMAWGGADTVLYEFKKGKEIFKEKASQWIYYDVTRKKIVEIEEHGKLLDIEDNQLIKHPQAAQPPAASS
jgi:hypothetical protein